MLQIIILEILSFIDFMTFSRFLKFEKIIITKNKIQKQLLQEYSFLNKYIPNWNFRTPTEIFFFHKCFQFIYINGKFSRNFAEILTPQMFPKQNLCIIILCYFISLEELSDVGYFFQKKQKIVSFPQINFLVYNYLSNKLQPYFYKYSIFLYVVMNNADNRKTFLDKKLMQHYFSTFSSLYDKKLLTKTHITQALKTCAIVTRHGLAFGNGEYVGFHTNLSNVYNAINLKLLELVSRIFNDHKENVFITKNCLWIFINLSLISKGRLFFLKHIHPVIPTCKFCKYGYLFLRALYRNLSFHL